MHIHIRTSVPGIEKTLPRLFLHLLHSLSYSPYLCCRVCCPRTLAYVGGNTWWKKVEWASRWPPAAEERKKEKARKNERKKGMVKEIGRIENRRTIRETQRKDSITSHKESKPSREINKRSPLLAIEWRCRRGREKIQMEERTKNSVKRTRRNRKQEKTSSAMICVIEILSVRSILWSTLTNIFDCSFLSWFLKIYFISI